MQLRGGAREELAAWSGNDMDGQTPGTARAAASLALRGGRCGSAGASGRSSSGVHESGSVRWFCDAEGPAASLCDMQQQQQLRPGRERCWSWEASAYSRRRRWGVSGSAPRAARRARGGSGGGLQGCSAAVRAMRRARVWPCRAILRGAGAGGAAPPSG
ncbi:hypothetical protein PLESTB_001239300 [Pleodorina starrii]|uniref:Uncharacterized protein n=1 Tax=Pleodorina starrii TaxID=330485 RepID=A0A9W6BT91_9CHLO|nr:hypothetical protein PLESTM_000220500 [Pleodorina starrii]GLC57550.1 hypothetical protein PLESTB_001239300 [Pleodorina starrii]